MNIIKIYEKYGIPENLQMHMLRVTACSKLILDNWIGEKLDEKSIIRVCLLHDMGNLVKMPEDFSDDKIFIKTRKKYYDKYGTNEHEINLEIAKEEGLSKKELEILDGKRSRKNEETLKGNSYEIKVCAYSDQRVAPNGVVSIKERLEDSKERYKNRPLSVWSDEKKANKLIECSLGIEKQIFEKCNIKPEDITNESIAYYIEEFKKYEI